MSTAALAAALAKVQAALPKLERDRTVEVTQKNGGKYRYSYVTLANLSDAILPLLAQHGLSFAAMPGSSSDGKMCLHYHLLHESGESLSGEFPISDQGGIQMVGGRITYARRYCLAALVGVAADEDDESRLANDGGGGTAQRANAPARKAAAPSAKRTAQRASAPPLPTDGPQPYTATQRAKLMAGFGQVGIEDRTERLDVVSRLIGREIASANELTQKEAGTVIDALEDAAKSDSPLLRLAELAPPGDADPAGDPPIDPAEG
jgi:hypothetical protein